jgi:tetratricopeptide (TPR) repeat protein
LFVWPAGLHLDYSAGALDGFLHMSVLLSLAFHATAISLAVWTWKRAPLVSFAILFYYLAHGIESSFIPIQDVIFEHRTYLPNFGLALLSGWFLLVLLPSWISSRAAAAVALVILIALGVTTWQRNQLWRDPVTLWTSNAEAAPTKARVYSHLARHLIEANRPVEGGRASQEAIRLQLAADSAAVVDRWDIINLITSMYLLQNYGQALALSEQFIDQPRTAGQRSRFHVTQGQIYIELERFEEAERSLQVALSITPSDIPARESYGRVLAHQGRFVEAESVYVELLGIDPGNQQSQQILEQIRRARQLHAPLAPESPTPQGADQPNPQGQESPG